MQISNRASPLPANTYTPITTGKALVPYTRVTDVVDINSTENGPGQSADPYNSITRAAANLLFSRHVSPSELTEVSLDLYAMGLMSFDDYSALANHPELNPNYNRTIGALTGEFAHPERRRDMVIEWEDKYRFLTEHSPESKHLIDQAERITNLLRALARKTNLRI